MTGPSAASPREPVRCGLLGPIPLAQVEAAERGLLKSKLLRADQIHDRMKKAQARLAEEYARFSEKDAGEWERLAQEMEKESAQVQWLRQQREKEGVVEHL